jgi:co-chaperonin GroES (HSP10)
MITKSTTDLAVPETLEEAFPNVDPGITPTGDYILLQLKKPKKKSTRAGIILVEETQATDKYNNCVAKVIARGPLAYKNAKDLSTWPEGEWVKEGDFVMTVKWGGARFDQPYTNEIGEEDYASFVIVHDREIYCKISGDPLRFKAFV